MNTQALRVCFGIINRPDLGSGCFLHDGCMAMHGTFCVWVCRSEGGANDEEEWSCIDASKVEREEEA